MTLGVMTFASLTNFGNAHGEPFVDDLGVRLSGPACTVIFLLALVAFAFYDERSLRQETLRLQQQQQQTQQQRAELGGAAAGLESTTAPTAALADGSPRRSPRGRVASSSPFGPRAPGPNPEIRNRNRNQTRKRRRTPARSATASRASRTGRRRGRCGDRLHPRGTHRWVTW